MGISPDIVSIFTWVRENTALQEDAEIINSLTQFATEWIAEDLLCLSQKDLVDMITDGEFGGKTTFNDFVEWIYEMKEVHEGEGEVELEIERMLSKWFHLA